MQICSDMNDNNLASHNTTNERIHQKKLYRRYNFCFDLISNRVLSCVCVFVCSFRLREYFFLFVYLNNQVRQERTSRFLKVTYFWIE